MSAPIRIFLRRSGVNANSGGLDAEFNPVPQRMVPRIGLNEYIAASVPVHEFQDGTTLWAVIFEFPTTRDRQRHIRRRLRTIKKAGKCWLARRQVPVTLVDVTEYEDDTSQPPVDGVYPQKPVTRKRSLRLLSRRMRFAGEDTEGTANIED